MHACEHVCESECLSAPSENHAEGESNEADATDSPDCCYAHSPGCVPAMHPVMPRAILSVSELLRGPDACNSEAPVREIEYPPQLS